MPRPRNRTTVAAVFALGLLALGGGAGAATYAALASDGTNRTVVRQVTVKNAEPAARTSGLSVNEIYRRAYKGVVEITVTRGGSTLPFGGSGTQQAQGSGFVYDGKGHVITNQHVVDGASSISVRFWNGATYKAAVVGTDTSTDLAVLRVDAPSTLLQPLSLGDSGTLAVGDGVVAIGSPFGLEETVTSGIVSALHRQIDASNGFTINDAIQTDAAINHGNSGGPLLDTRGQLVGVNAQIESDSGGNDGVGFAIPSSTVRSIAGQLLSTGKASHAYLGVSVATVPASAASRLEAPAGAEVTRVRGGTPAAHGGLRAASGSRTVDGFPYPSGGDVITRVDRTRIASAAELVAAIDARRPGDAVSLTYVRGGKSHTVRVKLAARP